LLVEIYKSTTDVDIKRRVIEALMGSAGGGGYSFALAGSYDTAITAYRSTGQDKRSEAAAAAANDLWTLYQSESVVQLKKQMLQALAMAQSEKIKELARTEKNQELRQAAIQNLGLMSSTKTGDTLVSLYKDEKNPDLKKAIIRGLYLQRNATALVQIARQESDLAVKKDVVEKLSTMKNKEATDYLLELLKK
ncbi:MAG: HEAT repeat domain-containing protein, partial [Planctomycetes bacterium]|nr:HEAT repeat domain-containing protein [Planctomycetota bacterium]